MELILIFFAGMFAFNAIPHLIKGISGQTHMTPFKRVSSPMLNVVWAFFSLALAAILLKLDQALIVFLVGGFLMSLADAWLFGNPNARFPWQKD